jgi:hypothetical protein
LVSVDVVVNCILHVPTDDAVDVITNVLLKEFDDCSDTVVGDTVHLSFGALAIVKPTSTG